MNSRVTLYIKTHNKTGLKYFGKTVQEGSRFNNYRGGGMYWKRHIEKHGYDVTTEIFGVFDIGDPKLVEVALQFSEENDIVNSKKWANLMFENGMDGGSKPGKITSEETKSKQSITHMGDKNPMFNREFSEEHKKKIGDGSRGRTWSEESKKKASVAKKGKKQERVVCPHCLKEGAVSGMKRWHFEKCKEM